MNWSSDPENHMEYKFEIVEILSDFDKDNGVLVAYMAKVEGFLFLFQRTNRARLAEHRIPLSEIFRFSHRIPSLELTGMERADVPVGSCELDPASLPDDLDQYHLFNNGKVNVENDSASCPRSSERKVNEVDKDMPNLRTSPRGLNGNFKKSIGVENKCNIATSSKGNNQSCLSGLPSDEVFSHWMCCPFCKLEYEYYKNVLNSRIKCPKCLNVYTAIDIPTRSSQAPHSGQPGMQNVNSGSNKGRPGVGGVSNPGYVVTGQSSTRCASSFVPPGVASTDEVHLLKKQMEEQRQDAKAREDELRKEIEELRKRYEEREAELRKRDEERETELRATREALKLTQEAAKKEIDDRLAAFERRFLSRDHPPHV